MTDMLQLALDSLREYEREMSKDGSIGNVGRLTEMRIGFAQALELRRIATALDAWVTATTLDAVSMTLHVGEE